MATISVSLTGDRTLTVKYAKVEAPPPPPPPPQPILTLTKVYAIPSEVSVNETVNIAADVANTGNADGSATVSFYADSTSLGSSTVYVSAGTTRTAGVAVKFSTAGTYTIKAVMGSQVQTGTLTVKSAPTGTLNVTVNFKMPAPSGYVYLEVIKTATNEIVSRDRKAYSGTPGTSTSVTFSTTKSYDTYRLYGYTDFKEVQGSTTVTLDSPSKSVTLNLT